MHALPPTSHLWVGDRFNNTLMKTILLQKYSILVLIIERGCWVWLWLVLRELDGESINDLVGSVGRDCNNHGTILP
jgi:hypothetical protein